MLFPTLNVFADIIAISIMMLKKMMLNEISIKAYYKTSF